MGKRAHNATAATKAPAKKSKVDPVFASVSEAILEAEQLPERVRTMLADMLPFSLKFASDERHDLQVMAVGMAEQTLQAKKSALDVAALAEANALAALKGSEAQLGTTVTESEHAHNSQKDVVTARNSALAEAKVHESDGAKKSSDLHAERTAAQANLATMQQEKNAIETAFVEHFKPMEEGDGKAHLKKLEPFLKMIEIESTLLTALPSSVGKAKDKRGTFDHLVLQELDKAFNAKIAALAAAVLAEGPASEQRNAAVQAADKDLDAKKADVVQADAESQAALKELHEREGAHEAASQAIVDFHPKVAEVTERVSIARTALEQFEAGPFANFLILQARVAAAAHMDKDIEVAAAEEVGADAEMAADAVPAAEVAAAAEEAVAA